MLDTTTLGHILPASCIMTDANGIRWPVRVRRKCICIPSEVASHAVSVRLKPKTG